MEDREFKTWWDLTDEEMAAFAKKVVEKYVRGWEELKQAAQAFGFNATDDIPTVLELTLMAKEAKSC